MDKARELIVMPAIDYAIKTIRDAVKELGIDGLEAGTVTFRIREEERSYMKGISNDKGTRLQEIFEQRGFLIHSKDSQTRPVRECHFTKEGLTVYCDIEINPLERLKAEQEKIAAEIARLEGEQHGAS